MVLLTSVNEERGLKAYPFCHQLSTCSSSKLSSALEALQIGAETPVDRHYPVVDEIEEQEIHSPAVDTCCTEIDRIINRLDRIMRGDLNGSSSRVLSKGSDCLYYSRAQFLGISGANAQEYEFAPGKTKSAVDPSAVASQHVEIMKLEVLAEMAALKSSLLAEIAKSRTREEELRTELAKSRAETKGLQDQLTEHESALSIQTHPAAKSAANPTSSRPLTESSQSRQRRRVSQRTPRMNFYSLGNQAREQTRENTAEQPETSPSFSNLRNLAREQVIKSVADKSSNFLTEMQARHPSGWLCWENALDWFEHHPALVLSLGLSMQDPRLT